MTVGDGTSPKACRMIEFIAIARGRKCLGEASMTARLECAEVAKRRAPPKKKRKRKGIRDGCAVAPTSRTGKGVRHNMGEEEDSEQQQNEGRLCGQIMRRERERERLAHAENNA